MLTEPCPIRVLPPDVRDRIAAGEVIENPAAVVRELVENSLDAGATEIAIDLARGGLDTIRVVDDGRGVPAEALDLAVTRHATSKIASLDDLDDVTSLGFRGEALASIAAVADLTLISRPAAAPVGARLRVRQGEIVERGPAGRSVGTTAIVQDLFAGLPARRRFLRDPAAETTAIAQAVRRLAVAHAGVRCTLRSDGRTIVQTSGQGRPAALGEVLGGSIAAGLIALPDRAVGVCRIGGYLGNRSIARPNRLAQLVFVNGRPAWPATFVHGLEGAYRGLLPRGRHPVLAIWIEAPPAEVDVNVHPSKREVRLRHERDLLAALAEEIRRGLGREAALAPLDGDFLFLGRPDPAARTGIAEAPAGWPATDDAAGGDLGGGSLPRLRLIGQLRQSLLMAESVAGVLLFDQHRVHETVIWHTLRATHPEAGVDLAEPLVLHLPGGDPARHLAQLEELAPLGFELEQFGPHAFLIRRVPAAIAAAGVPPDLIAADDLAGDRGTWRDRLIAGIACRTALPKGRALSPAEQARLIRDLDAVETPAVCPHGSPIILRLSEAFLDRQFRWR